MRAKTFRIVKGGIANGTMADAVGGAQVPAAYSSDCIEPSKHKLLPRERDTDAAEAHRIVAKVSLGKASIIFRDGGDRSERAKVIEELSIILHLGRAGDKPKAYPFKSMQACGWLAAVACDELASPQCPTCSGAAEIKMREDVDGKQPMIICPGCNGTGKRNYKIDERIDSLAKESALGMGIDSFEDNYRRCAKEIREHRKLRELIYGIELAKSILAECERVAVEETARMVERW